MAEAKPLIVIIGSLNVDFITTTPRCPQGGETLNATSLMISPGGKGANQAVGCGKASFTSKSSQDVRVEMVGATGSGDVYVEQLLLPTLHESGVGTEGIRATKDAQTGTATIIVETAAGSGENRILIVGGANHAGMDDLQEVMSRTDQVTGGQDPDVVVMQGEIPRPTVLGLLKHYGHADRKTKVVFNPAPVFEDGIPLDALHGLGALIVNETETILLTKSLKQQNNSFNDDGLIQESDLHHESNLAHFARQCHEQAGIDTVLVTLGARGVYHSTPKTSGLVQAVKVDQVVDTTAAGDTFVGYFATALARHVASRRTKSARGGDGDFDVAAAVHAANKAAARCVQRAGAMKSIPFAYEL